jgi:putative N-acetylmannosamine-6-phosphate epimerase/predicted NBD/HSP70 family sugar kinase
MDIIERLQHQLIVSCQAEHGFPLNKPEHLSAMAATAVLGGAAGIRASAPENIRAIKEAVDVPVIGIYKADYPGFEVRITPTLKEVQDVVQAGADIIALDATQRTRPGGVTLMDMIYQIKNVYNLPVMADVSTLEEGIFAANLGVDIIATTLSGYTSYSRQLSGPDIQLIHELKSSVNLPIIAEGRISTPEDLQAAFNAGAFSVVVGSMITRPHMITERFVSALLSEKKKAPVIAIDIGGTKIAIGLIDTDGYLLRKELLPTDAQQGGPVILDKVIQHVNQFQSNNRLYNPQAIGIATGGQIDLNGSIVGATDMIPDWIDLPLREKVIEAVGLPTVVLNDGQAAGLAEARLGAGKGQHSVLCIVIGTGLGGGLVIEDILQHGSQGLAGSIGQLKIRVNGSEYIPLEKVVSGPGLVEIFNQRVSKNQLVSKGEELGKLTELGDPVAIKVVQQVGAWLGLGLSHALHSYDAACVVIGGSVAEIGDLLLDGARLSLKEHGHSTIARTPIFKAKLGPDAGLIGAGLYAQEIFQK